MIMEYLEDGVVSLDQGLEASLRHRAGREANRQRALAAVQGKEGRSVLRKGAVSGRGKRRTVLILDMVPTGLTVKDQMWE